MSAPVQFVDFKEVVGLRKLGNPEGFRFFRWEFIDPDTYLMTGCVVTKTYTRGPKKGRPKYDGERRNVAVTEAEIEAAREAWAIETSKCGHCSGSGKRWRGWSAADGHRYDACPKCDGTGERTLSA